MINTMHLVVFYDPNFEKVGRAYCFRLVCMSVCVSGCKSKVCLSVCACVSGCKSLFLKLLNGACSGFEILYVYSS